jgi:dipeptidyl aminopeptidase/acylaminoacyl peptidase
MIRRSFVEKELSMSLVSAAVLLVAGVAGAAQDTHPFSVRDMLAMDRISDPRVSPDGKMVAYVVRTTDLDANKGRNDIWLAAVDGSWARRLTSHPESDTQPRWEPGGKRLYLVSTRSGSAQVHRIDLGGGEPEQVTRLPLDVDALEIAPGGAHALLSMRVFPGKSPAATEEAHAARKKAKSTGLLYERLFARHWDEWEDGTRNHLFSLRLDDGTVTDLMSAMDADSPSRPFGGSDEYAVTPDGRTAVFTVKDVGREEAWSTNFDLFAAPIDGKTAPRRLTTNPAWDTGPVFSPDGKTLAYRAMTRAGYEADRFDVVLRDWASGAERRLVMRADSSSRGDRSPGSLAWTADGGSLLVTAEHLGQSALFALDARTGATRLLIGEGTVVSPQPLPAGAVLYGLHSLLGPTELYAVGADGQGARRVTRANDAKVAGIRFGSPEQFRFEGALGETVSAYLVRPVDFDPSKRYPVAFLVHGGPQGSFGNDFHYRWNPQAYAGAGYAVVMVDFHGSTGYGQAFTDAINNDWGGKPFEDLMKGLDHALARYPFLDGARVAALGASYGGYMVNWIAGNTGRFKCLVTHDGNLDERMAYFDTEELWFPEWDHQGLPWERPDHYSKHNPVELVKNWQRHRTPMLVVHGGRDYRVVDTQGLSTFTALQRLGIPSKLLYFPDENHWVLKPANSILWHDTVLGWLGRWLR